MGEQKVTLITGSSTGIGQTTAIHLARHGYHVFASMRNPAIGGAALREVANKENLNLDIIPLDVTDQQSAEQAVQTILDKTGKLDILVNNAGISGGGPVEELPQDVLRRTFETNFFGAMRMMQLVLPTMRRARTGAIVNVTSVLARWISAQGSAYCASKAALTAASEAVAQEVKRFNIRVETIEAGCTATPLFGKDVEGMEQNQNIDSPYREFVLRDERLMTALLKNPSPPELVAKAIQRSLEEENPMFSYPVGDDAKGLIAGRKAMTDEEWIDSGREMTLDDYADFINAHFGLKI